MITSLAGNAIVLIQDVDRDGSADLVVANVYGDDVSILLNVGNGTFAEQARYAAGDGPRGLTMGDLDGNGASDIAVANLYSDDVSVLLKMACS